MVASLGKGIYNTTEPELKNVQLELPDLPASFSGVKIALLSDFHASAISNTRLFEQAATMTMQQKPDLILLAGDFITSETKFLNTSIGKFDRKRLEEMLRAISRLKAPLGIYATLGNHDFWSGAHAVDTIIDQMKGRLGAVVLRNNNVEIKRRDEKIVLMGVDDYWEKTCSVTKAYSGLDRESFKILLSHNPDINADIRHQMKIDLVLSGHTHGGQVSLPHIGMPFLPSQFGQKYMAGLVRDGKRYTYITRGVGYLMAPVRINCPPEVTVITLI